MTRTLTPLVAHVADPATPSPVSRAVLGLASEVRTCGELDKALEAVPESGEVVFLVERSALASGNLMWLILLAEARRGPVVLIEDERERDSSAALRAGVQSVVYAGDFESTAAVRALVIDAFGNFERRAPKRPWLSFESPPIPAATPKATAAPELDVDQLRDYVRDAVTEFRTPLATIAEFASILRDGLAGALNSKQAEYVDLALAACKEMENLFVDFRKSASWKLLSEDGAHEVFDIEYAVEEALARVTTSRVRFRVDGLRRPASVCADRAALVRAITCLAERAAKCSPRRSEVTVRLRTVGDVRLEVAVIDQGPSPTDSDIDLLQAGRQHETPIEKSVTRVFGVGIELACATLVRHGSRIELKACGNRGAQLSFALPVARR